ncbi:hypothetical protein PISMIDRAFT_678322 [Pisolithus microcarpus 441]|uniref:Uncharacterized protein n=1 Tax=Pisolithus microcarpus 441 TaxID=765257 RepID=A0A0C9YHJ0_9AGAM|nr:hypothetical protein PISMIDRAFT_678322 [Pisolithus microcarpus 441]
MSIEKPSRLRCHHFHWKVELTSEDHYCAASDTCCTSLPPDISGDELQPIFLSH